MQFLSRLKQPTSPFATWLSVISMIFIETSTFSQSSSGIEFKARVGSPGTMANVASPILPWVVGLVCLVLFGIMLATLWPNDSENNLYRRQRKFARVDGLFFKLRCQVCSEEHGKSLLKESRGKTELMVSPTATLSNLTLLSLSFGGCSLMGHEGLKKGSVILLHMHTLPDFPTRDLVVAAKVVWVRIQTHHNASHEVSGVKFFNATSKVSSESLRQYLNFLMDEPVT